MLWGGGGEESAMDLSDLGPGGVGGVEGRGERRRVHLCLFVLV